MSGSHKEFPKKAVGIQLGLAALVGIGFLFADKSAVHATAEKVTKPIVVAAQKVLAPIGKVEVKEEKVASAARTGEEVYASGCGTCHDNGVANAPKLDDKATWETRLSDGFTALVANPDNTDSEMELAVSHMIKKAGIELVAKSAAGNAAAPATEAQPAAAVKTEEAPKVEEVKAEVVEKAEEATKKVEEVVTEAKESVTEKVEEVKTEVTTAVASTATAAAAVVDHSKGEEVYKASCFACHQTGVANSPKLGDKAAWTARIEAGNDSMYTAAIKGKGAMPAKGGNMSISDDDVKAAVDYMVSKSK